MCGRYALSFVKGFATRFQLMDRAAERELEPRFNIAPTQDAPIIVAGSGNKMVVMRWGFIPFWAKDKRIGGRLINARAEGIAKRPAYRASVKKRRCIVPATGFYEWLATDRGKVPYYLHLKNEEIFGMAGLYDRWRSPDDSEIHSFTIITTEPNDLARPIHNRMPVILHREDEQRWLAPEPLESKDLEGLLKPYPADEMEAYRVSRDVNSPMVDEPELIEPVTDRRQKGS